MNQIGADIYQEQVSYTDENGNPQTVNIGAAVATVGASPASPIDIMTDGVSVITIIVINTGTPSGSNFDVSGTISYP